MSFQVLWANTGFANQHSACISAGGQLYGFSSQRGPIRIDAEGNPDTTFADKVTRTVEAWTAANVVVGWDSDNNMVIYMHGATLLAFNTTLERWCAPVVISESPMSISGSAVSAVTNGSAIAFSFNNSGTFTAYSFNTGTSGSIWEFYSTWRTGGVPGKLKTVSGLRSTFKHDDAASFPNLTTKVFKQGSNEGYQTSTPSKTITTAISSPGLQYIPLSQGKLNVRNAKAFLVSQSARSSGGGGSSGPVAIQVDGTIAGGRVF